MSSLFAEARRSGPSAYRFLSGLLLAAFFLFFFLFATAVAGAQGVRIFGKVKKQGSGFVLECTNVGLTSPTVDLGELEGDIVEIRGQNVGTASAPIIRVTSAVETDTFEMRGSGKIGESFRLRIRTDWANFYYVFIALSPGFTPLDPVPSISGTFLLNPLFFIPLVSGAINGNPYEVVYPIPNIPQLVGVDVYGQVALWDNSFPTTPLTYVNSACRKIQ